MLSTIKKKLASLFNTYDGACFGVTIWRTPRSNIQLWFVKPYYHIPAHTHPNENDTIIHLFGDAVFQRVRDHRMETAMMPLIGRGRSFTILSTDLHFFTASKWPLIFINRAQFINGHDACSAVEDMKLYRNRKN